VITRIPIEAPPEIETLFREWRRDTRKVYKLEEALWGYRDFYFVSGGLVFWLAKYGKNDVVRVQKRWCDLADRPAFITARRAAR
jgi:hypothetical protein